LLLLLAALLPPLVGASIATLLAGGSTIVLPAAACAAVLPAAARFDPSGTVSGCSTCVWMPGICRHSPYAIIMM
jgi:hypothetical protein